MEKVIAEHQMVGASGRSVCVFEIQEYRTFMSMQGRSQLPTMKRLELPDGSPVNFVDKDTFKVVATDEVLRRAA